MQAYVQAYAFLEQHAHMGVLKYAVGLRLFGQVQLHISSDTDHLGTGLHTYTYSVALVIEV